MLADSVLGASNTSSPCRCPSTRRLRIAGAEHGVREHPRLLGGRLFRLRAVDVPDGDEDRRGGDAQAQRGHDREPQDEPRSALLLEGRAARRRPVTAGCLALGGRSGSGARRPSRPSRRPSRLSARASRCRCRRIRSSTATATAAPTGSAPTGAAVPAVLIMGVKMPSTTSPSVGDGSRSGADRCSCGGLEAFVSAGAGGGAEHLRAPRPRCGWRGLDGRRSRGERSRRSGARGVARRLARATRAPPAARRGRTRTPAGKTRPRNDGAPTARQPRTGAESGR